MKVNIQFESTDADKEITYSNVTAVMEVRPADYRLTFVEDLSGDGNKTRSTIIITEDSLRLTRSGELNTDFIYGSGMVHNTSYGTPYGTMPVTVTTKEFSCSVGHMGKTHMVRGTDTNTLWIEPDYYEELTDRMALPDDFEINVEVSYHLAMGDSEPLNLGMKLKITKVN